MNVLRFGSTLSSLRKQRRLTQAELAQALNVTNKAVSKWENDQGYPEITLFPKIADFFGVTIDYLFAGEQRGIAIAGDVVVDTIKHVDFYPACGELSTIRSISRSIGGSVSNICIGISKIDAAIPVTAIGCIGCDDYGRYVLSEFHRYNIDTSKITLLPNASTSLSDIIVTPNGETTIYVEHNANDILSPEHVPISTLNCRLFYIGYLLLLASFDTPDKQFGTAAARFLRDVQNRGIETAVDINYVPAKEYPSMVLPSLKFCDYLICDETECCQLWQLSPWSESGELDVNAVRTAMQLTLDWGVQKVFVHSPQMSFSLSKDGEFCAIASAALPAHCIKGTVGAGDAFCSAVLYGLYEKWPDSEILYFANATSACCLLSENSVDGIKSKEEIYQLVQKYCEK